MHTNYTWTTFTTHTRLRGRVIMIRTTERNVRMWANTPGPSSQAASYPDYVGDSFNIEIIQCLICVSLPLVIGCREPWYLVFLLIIESSISSDPENEDTIFGIKESSLTYINVIRS